MNERRTRDEAQADIPEHGRVSEEGGQNARASAASGRHMHEASRQRWQPIANPDDPLVHRPPRGPRGPLAGPLDPSAPGRIAIVQAQVFVLAVIVIAQLWLVTTALWEWLSGRPQALGWLALASAAGFIMGLVVWWWPRRRVEGM